MCYLLACWVVFYEFFCRLLIFIIKFLCLPPGRVRRHIVFPLRPSVCLSVHPPVCLSVTKSCPLYNLITIRDLSRKLHMPHNQESFLCYEKSKIQRQPNIFCCRITFISPRNSQINTIFTITIKCSQVTIRYGKRSKFVPKKGNLAPSDYFTCMINPLCTRNPLTGNLTNSENPDEMLHYAGESLLISSLTGKALRTLVDITRLAQQFNVLSQSQAW